MQEHSASSELFLLPETESTHDGMGPVLTPDVHGECVVTLEITQAIANEGLQVAIWGSADGEHWGEKPLAEFPAKSYCGRYFLKLNLAEFPGARQLRAAWRMRSWAVNRDREPMFGFLIQLKEVNAAGSPLQTASAAA